jgi:hypothetical protein
LAAVVMGAQVGTVVVGMRADFQRYLVPVLIVAAVCGGVLAGQIWEGVRAWVMARRDLPDEVPASVRGPEMPATTLQT